ncbi:hypothetical protein PCANC_06718 [Puccinia coronata f. sp. avenae]|uniref:Uncharacterized protein n=1 Tax=Puccinia coronata f. sp. avenae TaxID=200324 RepID=A0A2N5VUA8_9BASI|nr:hypothetical protein PCANC_06718 [Puccinia coronata f. sp. avenae]
MFQLVPSSPTAQTLLPFSDLPETKPEVRSCNEEMMKTDAEGSLLHIGHFKQSALPLTQAIPALTCGSSPTSLDQAPAHRPAAPRSACPPHSQGRTPPRPASLNALPPSSFFRPPADCALWNARIAPALTGPCLTPSQLAPNEESTASPLTRRR